MDKSKTGVYVAGLIIVLIVFVTSIAATLFFLSDGSEDETSSESNNGSQADTSQITDFDSCADAGFPIMESFPKQCSPGDGRVFVEEAEIQEISTDGEYYGESTFSSCNVDTDCNVGGCNGEICGAASETEGAVSICLAPEEPLPTDLGYTCGCVSNQCQWAR
ncbi:MAG: hypothetical protein ACOCXP_04230 [Candidatus Dojkabacteria bacterium]